MSPGSLFNCLAFTPPVYYFINLFFMDTSAFSEADNIVLPASGRTNVIYWTIVLMIFGSVIMLPLVSLDVTVQAAGVIRPVSERTVIRSLVGGVIAGINYKDGDYVEKGSIVLRLHDPISDLRIPATTKEISLRKLWLNDLDLLLMADTIDDRLLARLTAPVYKAEASRYLHQMQDKSATIHKASKELQTATILFNEKVISAKEYEDKSTDVAKLTAAFYAFKNQQLTDWQASRAKIASEMLQLQTVQHEQYEDKNRHEIVAPVSGTVLGLKARYEGSTIEAGEVFCEISPEDDFIAECYMRTADIAFIKPGQVVKLQLEAFDHHYFGRLDATVISIDNDFSVIKDIPVYIVRCRLSSNELQGPKGYKGKIKKGLAFNARFLITQRKLSDLLFDKVEDWINPTI